MKQYYYLLIFLASKIKLTAFEHFFNNNNSHTNLMPARIMEINNKFTNDLGGAPPNKVKDGTPSKSLLGLIIGN